MSYELFKEFVSVHGIKSPIINKVFCWGTECAECVLRTKEDMHKCATIPYDTNELLEYFKKCKQENPEYFL